jgi:isoleucyl-tRNA synthetase
VRRVVTGALEIERKEKRIGSSLEAAPFVHVTDDALREAIEGLDMAEICITSGDDVGSDPEFPDVSARDAAALHELKAIGRL